MGPGTLEEFCHLTLLNFLFLPKVSSESSYLWMKSLMKFQKAELALMEECGTQATTLNQLTKAYNHYQEGLIDLKVT